MQKKVFIWGAVLAVLMVGIISTIYVDGQDHMTARERADFNTEQARAYAQKREYQEQQRIDNSDKNAIAACHQMVLGQLKAPATAKFSAGPEVGHFGHGKYGVTSYVDSQNGFGANLRTHFGCTLFTEDGRTFKGDVNYR